MMRCLRTAPIRNRFTPSESAHEHVGARTGRGVVIQSQEEPMEALDSLFRRRPIQELPRSTSYSTSITRRSAEAGQAVEALVRARRSCRCHVGAAVCTPVRSTDVTRGGKAPAPARSVRNVPGHLAHEAAAGAPRHVGGKTSARNGREHHRAMDDPEGG